MRLNSLRQLRNPAIRSGFVVASTTVLVITATFAALQSSASLTGNTISTIDVNLELSTDGSNFSHALPGFAFEDLIPGADAEPAGGYSFWIRNTSEVPLGLNVGVTPSPTGTVVPSGVIDFSKVILEFDREDLAFTIKLTLEDLVDSYDEGGLTLNEPVPEGGTPVMFTVKAKFLPGAFNGSQALISDFDLVFIGTHTIV